MPTYEFTCDECHTSARLQSSMHVAQNTPRCWKCDNLMRRIYSAPGIKFKGKGWGRNR